MSYEWIKALHVIAVISWMAGLLYLPRLYVYHSGTTPGSEASEMLKVMELKLLRYIMNPAMIANFVFGIWMMSILGSQVIRNAGWLHTKITLVVILTIFHGLLARWRKQFLKDQRPHSAKFFRWMNEVPTVLMIAIVILVIVKPF